MAYEKMPCLYDTERDLIDRLHNTICRYQGKAVLISVLSKRELSLHDPVSRKEIAKIKPNDEDFDISSPELGYMNHPDGVFYIERLPQRRFRQGLTEECCRYYEIDGQVDQTISGVLMSCKGAVDMIENHYPNFREALLLLMKDRLKEVAVSRDIAMKMLDSGLILVFCRCRDIGYILPDSFDIEYKSSPTSWVVDKMLERAGISKRGKSVWH